MAFTVTATQSGSSSNRAVFLLVRVLTNAIETGGATSGANNTSGVVAQGSLTPAASGSWVGFSVGEDGVTTGLNAAAANNVYDANTANTTDGWSSAQGHYTGTVTGGTPLTYGEGTFASGDHSNWCAYEVKASGGTIAIDGSSPPFVSTLTLTAITTAAFTPPAGSVLVALITAGGSGSGTGITMTITDTSGLGLTWTRRAISSATDNYQPTFVYTTTVPGGGAGPSVASLPEPLIPPGMFSPMAFRQHGWAPVPAPQLPPVASVPLADSGYSSDALGGIAPLTIAQILGTGSGQYFADQGGKPRMWLGDEIWAMCTNAGRWNSGNYQATFDSYFATRASQGFTICYTDMFNSTFIGGATNGQMWNGQTPYTSNNPSSGLNNSYWTVIDYMLNSAAANGITVALSFGGHWDWDVSGNAMFGFTGTQYQAAGNAIGTRYKGQQNLIWMIMDDYFSSFDSSLTSLLTGLRASGDTHPIAIENYAETTSRFTLDTSTSMAWGAANTQYNFGYSYSCTYLCIEYMYAEASPMGCIYGDGYFYQGGTTYDTSLDRAIRQDAWWAVTSGARGWDIGDEALWQWPSSAPASVSTQWFAQNNAGNIRTFMESLTGWQTLAPATGSTLITAGRGTRATQLASGGSGGQYEPATTNGYVSASRSPDTGSGSSLAIVYMPLATTITIDQTKLAAGYTATWVDPITCATSSATVGSTYNSTAKGNNSRSQPDWVLVFQAPSATSVPLTDAGASADALAVSQSAAVALTDAGASADLLAVTQPAALTDAGAGADALGVLPRMADTGTSADALAFTLTAALADTGTSADIFAVTQPATLADTGSSAEGFAPGALLTDAGASADALATLAVIPVPLTDTGTSADALSVLSVIPVPLADTGTSADVLAVTAVVPLADASASVEGFWPGALLADTGTSADTLILAAAVPQADTGTGTDAFWPGTALADTGASADTLPVAQPTALADTGTGTDQVFVPAFADAGASLEVLNNGSGQTNNFTDTGTSTDVLAPGILNAVTLADAGVAADLLFVPAFADTGASADLLPVTQPTPLPDAGTGADLLFVPGFADTGNSAEAFSSGGASTTALADAGASADLLFVPAFADAGTSAEAFSGGAFSAPNLPDTGTGTDILAVPGFAETGTSAESFTVTALTPLPDTGSAADALAVPGFADTGTSADALVAGQFNAIPLTQAAASAETLTVAAIGVTLADAGAGTDLLFVPGFAETGTSADALAVPVAGIPLADAGTSSEALAALASLPDTGHAADVLVAGPVVPVPLTDTGHGTDICRIQLFVPGILTAATSPATALTGTTASPAVLTAATAAGGPSLGDFPAAVFRTVLPHRNGKVWMSLYHRHRHQGTVLIKQENRSSIVRTGLQDHRGTKFPDSELFPVLRPGDALKHAGQLLTLGHRLTVHVHQPPMGGPLALSPRPARPRVHDGPGRDRRAGRPRHDHPEPVPA